MLPILVDLSDARVVLVGRGKAALNRLRMLEAAKVGSLDIYNPYGDEALASASGARAVEQLPDAAALEGARLVFLANLEPEHSDPLVSAARGLGILTNTEDDLPRCDFHVPAIVRRGDLVLTVSTGGASPALARLVRQKLEKQFGPEWDERVVEISNWRRAWRNENFSPGEITERTKQALSERGWL